MFMFILCNNILIKATRRLGCLFCSFSLCACQSTLSSVWCDVGIWWSGHKVFRNIPQPRHEPFPPLASATGKQQLIVLQLTVYNALTHLDNNKLNGETSCIPTPVPASVQSVSGQSFMIEILQRCQHNNTTTNVHFNGSLRRIKFFIPSASLNELPAPNMFVNSWMMQTADCTFVLFVQLFDWSSLEYFPSVLTNMNCYNDTLSPQLQAPCHGAACDNGGVTRVTSCQIKMMNPSTIHSSLLISALCAVFIVYFWN